MRNLMFLTLIAALTGCPNNNVVDLTATNAAIGDIGTKIEANTAAIKANAPAPAPAPIDPESCKIDGKTAADEQGRIKSTDDALLKGEIVIHGCDIATAPNGSRWWFVKGVKAGNEANNQEDFLVDSHGNVLTFAALRGITSQTVWVKPKGTHFQVQCRDISGDGTGCNKIKVEKPDTVIVVNGHTVTISGS